VSQNLDNFKNVSNWFRRSLKLIAPDSRFAPFKRFMDEKGDLSKTMNHLLPQFDTGISHFCGETIPIESIPLFKNIKAEILEELKEGTSIGLAFAPTNERIIVTRENGELRAEKVVTCHLMDDGTEARFDFSEESDGTQRLLDLLPAFFEVSKANSDSVFVIDEIDRSLHTVLTRRLIESFLSTCSSESRTQLLFTTHDVLLMDQELLRRDEMWVSERDASGSSNLLSFSEFKEMRYDKDIRKSYLQGRLGGVPRILIGEALSIPSNDCSDHHEVV
jgi:AAA15 family ATPase/GTPase